ncbi:MAG: hypothetical protein AB1791_01895 [Chloroflexota bacterium]
MNTKPARKPRPYWHVDAKWMTSLILVVVLSITLLLFNLWQLTAEKPAVEILSTAMALAFSPNGLDEEIDLAAVREQIQASPDGLFHPLPGLPVTVREEEITNLSPRELRLYVFRQLAEPIYQGGVEGLAAQVGDPEAGASIVAAGRMLNLFTLETHRTLERPLAIAAALSGLLLIPLVIFSYRFGRLGCPGCVFVAASLPTALLLAFLSTVDPPPGATPPGGEGSLFAVAGSLVTNLIPLLIQTTARTYLVAVAAGLLLLLLALLWQIIWSVARRRRPAESSGD